MTTNVNDTVRISPAFAGALSTTTNNECRDFMQQQLVGIVTGSDEWVIKLDSLAHLGELTTREIYSHCKRANNDKPQDAYRQRLAQLGLWPKSLKGTTMKPVNEKDCAERGGQYKTRAKVFECLRKMASADKKALELAKADEAARAKGFANAAAEQEALAQTAVMALPDPPAEIVVPADVLATTVDAPIVEEVKIATGPSNSEFLAQGRELLRRLAVGGLDQDDVDDIVAELARIFDRVQGVTINANNV